MTTLTALARTEAEWVRRHPLLALYIVIWPVIVALVAMWTAG